MDAKSKLAAYQADQKAKVQKYATAAGASLPGKYAQGGAVKSKKGATNITIVIGKGGADQNAAPPPMAVKPPPVVLPPPAPPMAGPPPGPPPGGPPMGMPPGMPGMKRGGKVMQKATALPMTAGAASGPGREQKADSEAKKEGKSNKGDRV